MEDLKPFVELLGQKMPWLIPAAAALYAWRIPAKIISAWLQRTLTAFVDRAVTSPEADDDDLLFRIFSSKPYRLVAFGIDALFSVKLPTTESLLAHWNRKSVQHGVRPLNVIPILLVFCTLMAGCRALAPDGVYRGDQVLFHAEMTITTSYELIHTFVDWEYQNRSALARWPEIKRGADVMRADSPNWFRTAYAMRDAYALDPSNGNRQNLERALNVLRAALAEATGYMARATN